MSGSASQELYYFVYRYQDSPDSYFGTVAAVADQGLKSGQTISGKDGTYTIIADGGSTDEAAGTVTVTSYFSSTADRAFITLGQITGSQRPSGTEGLGSEVDQLITPPVQDPEPSFGPATPLTQIPTSIYGFVFTYADGNSYTGTIAENGLTPGEIIPTAHGSYQITGVVDLTGDRPGPVSILSFTDASTGATYAVTPPSSGPHNTTGLGSEYALVQPGNQPVGEGGQVEPAPSKVAPGDSFIWIGGQSGAFDTAANWYDTTKSAVATKAPGSNDYVAFNTGTLAVSGTINVAGVSVTDGARVAISGISTDHDHLGALAVTAGAHLSVTGAVVDAQIATVGAGSVFDMSEAALPVPTPDDPFLGDFGQITLEPAASPGQSGGQFILGSRTLGLHNSEGPTNENAGYGNSFDPRAGISGTGTIVISPPSATPEPEVNALATPNTPFTPLDTIDFGTVHVGQTAVSGFSVMNAAGDAGTPVTGAVQTDVNGASITDSDLSGPGVTAQNFTIGGRGEYQAYPIFLDATKAGSLDGQAVHVAYMVDGSIFDAGQTIPIIGEVLNYAAAGFVKTAGPARLTHHGTAWTLDFGTLSPGQADELAALAVGNIAKGPADLLSGSFSVAGDPGFRVDGADAFSGVAAGTVHGGLTIRASAATTLGVHSAMLVLHPTGSNDSGYSGALGNVTLTIRDRVAA